MKNKLLILIAAIVISITPAITLGQAPDLGTTANFELFSTDGAVTNTGTSHITGKVGTNNGPVTGFGNVNGGMHAADGVTAQAATDLLALYNELDATTPTLFLSSPLGNGNTITAGIYSVSGASTLNLDLTLDGEGNSSAVFIIHVEGSFSTNANSKVKLINGAKACNVFWKIEGLLDMATNTSMKGTLVVNNAAIKTNSGCTLEGRALTTTGALSVNGILAYTPIGCGSPTLNGPSAPTLGKAGCYGIFSSVGPVANSGITNVTGDVGSNSGLTTGYAPLLVTGEIHPIPDASTAQAASDLLDAYNYLNGLAHDIELLYPAQFGANLELTPHTYLLNAATTFTDTLILNAQGNSSAVFVIKIYGALSTSTYSTVKLTNGAKAENVYWMINGAIDINDYSLFNGSVVSQGAINMYTGVTINGRILSANGAIETHAIKSAATITSDCGSQLLGGPTLLSPVNDTTINQQSVTLKWNTLNNVTNYILDVSKDASFATKIVDAEVLTTNTRNLTNLIWDQTIYWRVKAVINGEETKWSSTWKFDVFDNTAPALLSPVNDTTINQQSVTLKWNTLNNVTNYILDVSKDASFATKIVDAAVLTTNTKNLTNLDWDQTIYWRVKAVINGKETKWSSTWKFDVFDNTAPTLLFPVNDTTINQQSVTLKWNTLNNVTNYILDVSKDASFATKIVDAEVLTTNTRNLTNLIWDQKIYWRVKAIINGKETKWSDTWKFDVIDITPPTVLFANISSDYKNNSIAVTGSKVTVSFETDELFTILDSEIEGHYLTVDNVTSTKATVSYVMTKYDYSGNVTFGIRIADLSGNITWIDMTTDGSKVDFQKTPPNISIFEQPSDLIECVGTLDQFLFAVAALDDRFFELAYRWYKDGKPISEGRIDNGIYNFDTLDYKMSGVYMVEIWAIDTLGNGNAVYLGTSGSAESMRIGSSFFTVPINVYVLQRPSFMKDLKPVTAGIGSSLSLTFEAHIYGEHNSVNPTYWTQIQWFRGTTALTDNQRYEGTQASIFNIENLQATDYATDYRVRLIGECDTTWSNYFVISEHPYATITEQPISVEGCVSDVVQLTAEAEATLIGANLAYQWWVDGAMIMNEAGKFSGANTPNLNITLTLDLAYDGTEEFTCQVWPVGFPSNGTVSDAAMITWKAAPSITTDLNAAYTAKEEEKVEMLIIVTGDNLTYTWTKDGNDLANNSDKYTIDMVAMADAGEYVVTVSNDCGEVTSATATLAVTAGPIITSVNAQVGLGLSQNYPNPFGDNTTVTINSQMSGNANVVMTDMLGNVVANLYNGNVKAGTPTPININANNLNLNSGTYFITLRMGDKVETRQISVVR